MTNKKPLVGVVGTHGLPANYSGWETLVKNLVRHKQRVDYLVATPAHRKKNHDSKYANISIYIPLNASGWQSIFYDLISLLLLIRRCDSILILGISGCIFLPFVKLFTKKNIIVNTDGIEYRRQKWGIIASSILKLSEGMAVKYASKIVADNKGIAEYILKKYKRNVDAIIEYGGIDKVTKADLHSEKYKFKHKCYDLAIARIVPENNIETILNAYNNSSHDLVFIGNWMTSKYSKSLYRKRWSKNINLFMPDFNELRLTSLRKSCRYYVHGHSAGGTNPSLVEALSIGCNILCFNINFNRVILSRLGSYWKCEKELKSLIDSNINSDYDKIVKYYLNNFDWKKIVTKYELLY